MRWSTNFLLTFVRRSLVAGVRRMLLSWAHRRPRLLIRMFAHNDKNAAHIEKPIRLNKQKEP